MIRFLTLCLLARILAAQCPNLTAFTPPEKIQSTDRAYRFEGGYVAAIGEMCVDSDGSPVAYHPLNLGTTHLCNGLDPVIDGKRVRDKKRATSPCFAAVEKAIQAKWDPARSPEFFIYGFVAPTTGAKGGGPARRQANSGAGRKRPRARFFHLHHRPPGAGSRRLARVPALPECRRNTVRGRPHQPGERRLTAARRSGLGVEHGQGSHRAGRH